MVMTINFQCSCCSDPVFVKLASPSLCYTVLTNFSLFWLCRIQYLVSWEGYGPADNTWEPEAMLMQDVPKMVKAFEDKHAKKKA